MNLVENQDDIQKALNETLKNPNKVRTDINYNAELIDTSSFIFKYDKKIIDQIHSQAVSILKKRKDIMELQKMKEDFY